MGVTPGWGGGGRLGGLVGRRKGLELLGSTKECDAEVFFLFFIFYFFFVDFYYYFFFFFFLRGLRRESCENIGVIPAVFNNYNRNVCKLG